MQDHFKVTLQLSKEKLKSYSAKCQKSDCICHFLLASDKLEKSFDFSLVCNWKPWKPLSQKGRRRPASKLCTHMCAYSWVLGRWGREVQQSSLISGFSSSIVELGEHFQPPLNIPMEAKLMTRKKNGKIVHIFNFAYCFSEGKWICPSLHLVFLS